MEYIDQAIGWFSLPPAPITGVTAAQLCLDGKNTFVYNGTQCSVFNYASRSWSPAVACPTIVDTSNFIVSQLYGDYYNIIGVLPNDSNQPTYLMHLTEGLVKKLNTGFVLNSGQYIISSDYAPYGNFSFPNDTENSFPAFYVEGYPKYVFIVCASTGGPLNYLTFAYDIMTGFPKFQFAGGSQFAGSINGGGTPVGGQGEMSYYGIPGTFNINPAFGTIANAGDIAHMIKTSPADIYATLSFQAPNNSFYICPFNSLTNNEPAYGVAGFSESIINLAYNDGWNITQNFIYYPSSAAFTYTPYTFTKGDYSQGYFGLGVTLPPPISIPINRPPVFGILGRPVNHMTSGNIFGFFNSDFSEGYYLGIAQSSFQSYQLNNYRRYDD